MKNHEQSILLCITVLCVGLMTGILIGRLGGNHAVQLSAYDRSAEERPSQTAPYRSENIGKVNINSASAEELSMIPGIGDTYAQRIVEYRNKHGAFIQIEDLANVKGIGEGLIKTIKEYITVGG